MQYVIQARQDDQSSGNGLPSIGARAELLDQLSHYNTAPESGDADDILYGPGIRIELPPGDPINQLLLSVTEEEIAWPVMLRLCRDFHWSILDPNTGRMLNP